MSFAVAAVLIFGLAALIAYPLVAATDGPGAEDAPADREMLEREKHVALLAIREADLDRAMGKLSDDDYAALRGVYERRAVDAMSALDAASGPQKMGDGAATSMTGDAGNTSSNTLSNARFCAGCGRGFVHDERFCPACGRARSA